MRVYYTWRTGQLREVKGEVVREQPLTVFVNGGTEAELRCPVELPKERILTSGCGGGTTFRIDPRVFPRIDSTLRVAPARLFERMKDLYLQAVGYRASRGIHGAPLADPDRLPFMAAGAGRP